MYLLYNKKKTYHINHQKTKSNVYKKDEKLQQIVIRMVKKHVGSAFLTV